MASLIGLGNRGPTHASGRFCTDPRGILDYGARHDAHDREKFVGSASGVDRQKVFVESVKDWTLSRLACTIGPMMTDPASLLRERNLKVTAQRLAVLRAVSARPHCTAEAVVEQVRREIGTISRQAVYDALGVLADSGLLRRIEPAGSPALYECRAGDNHHHLICRACGKTVDVDCVVGGAPCLTPSDPAGYQIDEAEVIFWGKCPECVAASGGPAEGRPPRARRLSPGPQLGPQTGDS